MQCTMFSVFLLKPIKSLYHQVWQELGAVRGLNKYSFSEFIQVEDADGKAFKVYSDIEKLENHMKTR